MSSSRVLTDHDAIRSWAAERGGRPSRVVGTGDKDDAGLLRFDFGDTDDNLEEISWDEFFETFEDRELGLICGVDPHSRFNKFINRE